MSKNLELSLVMRLRDLASSGFNRANRDIQNGIASTGKATDTLTRTVASLGKARSAAGVLGIRTEQNIQREIQRTEAAYNRLQKSGTLSMREQARAADATRNKIRELNNEMGKYTLGQKAMSGLQTGATVAGGLAAGGYVLSKPVGQTMDYGVLTARIANLGYGDRDFAGKRAGQKEINETIVNATRDAKGGVQRGDTAEALNSIIASWQQVGSKAMKFKDVLSMLPAMTTTAAASGANVTDLGQIAMRSVQTLGIKPEQVAGVMNMAYVGGQEGSFELKDMAKHLPDQMAKAVSLGMTGPAALSKLIAANQAVAITAGSSDQAGNNLSNLLGKINSRDTAKIAQDHDINLSGTLAAARAKGIDAIDAFTGVIDEVVGRDKNYKALKAKLKTASGAERKAILEAQVDILQGSAIGQMLQDREALSAQVAIMGNREYMSAVDKKALTSFSDAPGTSAREQGLEFLASQEGFKTQNALNEKLFATQNAFEKLTPFVGAVADGFSSIAKEYPLLTSATVAATTALTALAAAAIGMAGISVLTGGKGAGLTGLLAKGLGLVSGARALALPGLALTGAIEGGGAAINAYRGKDSSNMISRMVEGTAFSDLLGETIARSMAIFGNQNAKEAVQINLHLDGEQIAAVVNQRNSRTASRN